MAASWQLRNIDGHGETWSVAWSPCCVVMVLLSQGKVEKAMYLVLCFTTADPKCHRAAAVLDEIPNLVGRGDDAVPFAKSVNARAPTIAKRTAKTRVTSAKRTAQTRKTIAKRTAS